MSDIKVSRMAVPFESASELREAHIGLLEALDKQLGQDVSIENEAAALAQIEPQIRQFMERGAATGIYIEEIKDRTACQILLDYWVSSLTHAGKQFAAARLSQFDGTQLPDLKDKPCPYVGLEAFRDRTFFFGREAAVQKLLEQIREAPLVVVLGASGSGKSSLVMGGVLPALREKGSVPELRIIPPFVPGNAVLNHLADAILGVCTGAFDGVAGEAEKLRQDPLRFYAMAGGADAPPTLITIDQFEEVFTLSDAADRDALVSNLTQFIESGRGHRVILTMREEFRSRMVELRGLSSYIDKAWFSIMPMGYEELKDAVERPAALVNLQFQSGIVDDLIKKVLGQPAALPLLQFTLRSLWEKRDRNRITWEVYHKVGDPLNALKASADHFYDGLVPETRDEVKRILLELVRVDELLEAYRQPVPKNRLLLAGKANTEEVLKLLAENDYLRITSGATESDIVVEIKHESLVRNWPCFVTWVDEKRHQRRQRLALTQSSQRWSESGKPQEGLLTEWQAQAVKDLEDLSELEKEFVQASIAAVDRMQMEKEAALVRAATQENARRFHRNAARVSFIVMVVFGVLFWMAKNERDRAEGLISFLIGEQFLGEVRDTGRSSMLKQVEEHVGAGVQRTDLNRGLALRNRGDIALMQGLLKDSVDLFGQALTSIERSPDNPIRWRETARTHERLGEAFIGQGQLAQALTHYEAAIKDWRQVVANTSTVNTDDCTSLADSLVFVGDLKTRMGEANLALEALKETLNITADILIGRQTSHKGCGPADNKTEPYLDAKALEVFSHAIMLRAQILNSREDYDGVEALAKEAKKLRPHSVSARKNAYTALVYRGQGRFFDQPQRALDDYRKALAGFESLRQRDPDNRQWQRERAANQLLVGEGLLACSLSRKCKPMPSLEEAEATILEATAALRALALIDQSNVSLQSDVGWALETHAKVLAAQGRKHERLEKIKEAEQAYLKAQPDKTDASGVATRGRLLVEKADVLATLGRLPEANETVQKAIDLFKGLIATHQDNPIYVANLYEIYTREAEMRRMAGDRTGFEVADREVSKLSEQYVKIIQKSNSKADKLEDAHYKHVVEGAKLFKSNDYAAALREFNNAESAMREYIQLIPTDFRGYDKLRNIYSWLQLMQEKLRNAKEYTVALRASMQAAQIAVLLAPKDSKININTELQDARHQLSIDLIDNKLLEEALAMLQVEVADSEGLVQEDSKNAINLWRLGDAKCGIGMIRRKLKMAGWEEAIRSGLIHIQKSAAIDSKNKSYLTALGFWRKNLAGELEVDGLKEKAAAEYHLALKSYQKAVILDPKDAEVKNDIRELAKLGYR